MEKGGGKLGNVLSISLVVILNILPIIIEKIYKTTEYYASVLGVITFPLNYCHLTTLFSSL